METTKISLVIMGVKTVKADNRVIVLRKSEKIILGI